MKEVIGTVIICIALVIGFSILCCFPIMWLWNWLMPILFGLPTISLGQAFGLKLLAGFLFGAANFKGEKEK